MLATFQPDWQIKQVLFVQKGDDYHLCVFGSGVKTFWMDISFISEEYIKVSWQFIVKTVNFDHKLLYT